MKRKDWLIIGIVLAVSLSLFLLRPASLGTSSGTAYLRITVPGKSFPLTPLTGSSEIEITQEDGSHNVVEVFEGGFRMKESDCHNQDCVHQGDVTLSNIAERPLANQIICLPHKVVLELVAQDGSMPETN